VRRVRARLIGRLADLGFPVTDDPALWFVTDRGEAVVPQVFEEGLCLAIPDGAARLSVRSRHGIPAAAEARRLGVAVAALRIDGATLALDDGRFMSGWHAPEPGLRWSDGAGVLDVRGAGVAELQVAPIALRYIAGAAETRYAATA
jgi:hypothetical protein